MYELAQMLDVVPAWIYPLAILLNTFGVHYLMAKSLQTHLNNVMRDWGSNDESFLEMKKRDKKYTYTFSIILILISLTIGIDVLNARDYTYQIHEFIRCFLPITIISLFVAFNLKLIGLISNKETMLKYPGLSIVTDLGSLIALTYGVLMLALTLNMYLIPFFAMDVSGIDIWEYIKMMTFG